MVKLRSTRVEAIAHTNGWRGQILRTVHSQLDAYLSACQLGITLASLGLGWVGEPAFAHILEPLLGAAGRRVAGSDQRRVVLFRLLPDFLPAHRGR